MSSYDFDLALARHAMWLTRLKLYTMGVADAELTPELAANSTRCELGTWMAEVGAEVRALPGFELLEQAHQHFHHVAGEVVRLHQAGDESEVRMLLEEVLPRASEEVSLTLQQLRDRQGKAGA